MNNKNRSVIIVAGGTGKRMGSIIPKQFIELSGKPMLMWTIGRFYIFDKKMQIILVLPKNEIARWGELCNKHNFTVYHQIVAGGKIRFESVKKGFSVVNKGALTAIHDGVRPLVSYETIKTCFTEAEKNGNAIPVLRLNESIRLIDNNKSKTLNRDSIRLIQTPQVFRYEQLVEAYNQNFRQEFTDDASVVESMGFEINMVEGNYENIKITRSIDLEFAKTLFRSSSPR